MNSLCKIIKLKLFDMKMATKMFRSLFEKKRVLILLITTDFIVFFLNFPAKKNLPRLAPVLKSVICLLTSLGASLIYILVDSLILMTVLKHIANRS